MGIRGRLEEKLLSCTPEQQKYMRYFAKTMPLSDLMDVDFSVLLSYVDHALMLRKRMPWCRKLDEITFREYVLYYRVNSEGITDCRPFFYSLLKDRLAGLTEAQAIREVNRWCHENASYQAQDERTASPMTVYTSGSGRCGEESTFLVSALRSVGIPARQVYTPRWAHCDDNHAWVEALCDGGWVFLGACEPEPVLDRGWFNAAAARAMMVHSRSFAGEDDTQEPAGRQPAVVFGNQTGRYARTKEYIFTVLLDGAPAAGALVEVQLLNMAEFYPIASLETDESGAARVRLGLGDFYLSARREGFYGEAFCQGEARNAFTVTLAREITPPDRWSAFDFHAPEGGEKNAVELTLEQKEERQRTLRRGTLLREARIAGFYDEKRALPGREDLLRNARGNFDEVYRFLTADNNPLREVLLRSLSEKDLRDCRASLLESHLRGAEPFAESHARDIFINYILCPRILFENLSDWRAYLGERLPGDAGWREDPRVLWKWLKENIKCDDSAFYSELYLTPESAWREKIADSRSLGLLFVAACRTLGIPARIRPLDRRPEYWRAGAFHLAEPEEQGDICFTDPDGTGYLYGQNFTVARFSSQGYRTLDLSGLRWEGGRLAASLPCGKYRLITVRRLPNGNQFGYTRGFLVGPGENGELRLRLRSLNTGDLLENILLPSFSAADGDGKRIRSKELFSGDRYHLLFWLEEGMEPTEHVLNELSAEKERLRALNADITFFLRDKSALKQKTLGRLLDGWKDIRLLFGEWEYNEELLARQMFCDPDRAPLALCVNPKGRGIYACSGYNVGSVELLARIVETND